MTEEDNKLLKILHILRDSDPRQGDFRFQAEVQARIVALQLREEKEKQEDIVTYINKRVEELLSDTSYTASKVLPTKTKKAK